MPNEYKSFYFADLKAMVRETAMENMLSPIIEMEDSPVTTNANIALYNDGIRTLAQALIEKLTDEAKG